jgi:ribosomal protein S18 acetylase RimI-like enzyme
VGDITLRPATAADVDGIADIWHRGWRDGHLGNVPPELEQYRGLEEFRRRVPSRLAQTTVATDDGRLVGFVTLHDDEVEQIYVDSAARGGGAATALLHHGEEQIARRYDVAWLAVAAGNARARRFYERSGWTDTGVVDYVAETSSGPFVLPCHRYERPVR